MTTQEQLTKQVRCPCCGVEWDERTAQHASVVLFGKCCFSPTHAAWEINDLINHTASVIGEIIDNRSNH